MPVNVMATLRRALRQLEGQRARIDSQIAAIRSVLGAAASGSPPAAPRRRRRRMKSAARRALSQRMKAYWVKRKAAKAKGTLKGGRPK